MAAFVAAYPSEGGVVVAFVVVAFVVVAFVVVVASRRRRLYRLLGEEASRRP